MFVLNTKRHKSLAIFILGFSTGSLLFSGKLWSWIVLDDIQTSSGSDRLREALYDGSSDHITGLMNIIPSGQPRNTAKTKTRLLCMVNSNSFELDTKAAAVNNTWGRRCDILLFVCEKNHPDLPILKVNVPIGREFLSFKHREALDLIYKNYLQAAEWFLKADVDTYVFVDNLREYLADKDYNDPSYYGHHFVTGPKSGYFSGGSGYVFSREAMKRFGERWVGDYRNESSFADDMLIGYAMEKLNVTHVDGRDSEKRMLFFPLGLYPHFYGDYPEWYIKYDGYTPPYASRL